MARGVYDTTGWVTPIALDDVIDEGFEALHAGHQDEGPGRPVDRRRGMTDIPPRCSTRSRW